MFSVPFDIMDTYQYPLKMEISQKKKILEFANRERRSFNQTILVMIDKYLNEGKNAAN